MARDPNEDGSVYDFLYVDERRVAQFLSQFTNYGHLTGLTRAAGETRSGGGGINVGAAKIDRSTVTNEAHTRHFDPRWLNPLTFLDEAQRRDMIVRDIGTAAIGQLILMTGRLGVFDVSIFQAVWGVDGLIEGMAKANAAPPDPRQRKERRGQPRGAPTEEEMANRFAKALIPKLPHLVQGSLFDRETSVWFVLKEDSLVVSQSDLLLKHGISIAGEWSAVGVLDAKPDAGDIGSGASAQAEAASMFGILGEGMPDLVTPIRAMFGRPDTAYGMTPILVFREVSGSAAEDGG